MKKTAAKPLTQNAAKARKPSVPAKGGVAAKVAAKAKPAPKAKPIAKSKTTVKQQPAAKPKAAPLKKAPARPAVARKTAAVKAPVKSVTKGVVKPGATGDVLKELKSLAKELSRTAKGLGTKAAGNNPGAVANILGNVERMTADAATKSLLEAESAKHLLSAARDSLGKDWSRKELDSALAAASQHLTNIIVAQEFQDLAGQAIRKAMKALVGAIIVVEGNAGADDGRLSQSEVDKLLDVLNK